MALGDVRYTCDYVSENGSTFKLEIFDSEYTGATELLDITSEGAVISYEASNRDDSVLASKLQINCVVNDDDFETFINDIATSGEDRFAVKLQRNGFIFWLGYLLPDLVSYNDESYPYLITLEATDALGILKDIPFSDSSGNNYTGNDSLMDILIKILYNKTNISNFYDGDGYAITKSLINWYELHHIRTANYCPLRYTQVDQSVFLTDDDNTVLPMNCLDVIRNICDTFNARIYQSSGVFQVEQMTEVTDGTIYYRQFNRAATLLSSALNDRAATMTSLKRLSGGVYSFLPPLKNVKTAYNYRSPIGYIDLPEQLKYETFVQVGTLGSNVLKIHFYGSITQTFSYTQYYEFQTYWRVVVKIVPAVGNPWYLTNNGLWGGVLEWNQSAIEKYVTVLGYPVIYPTGYIGITFNYGDAFDLLTPDIGNNITGDVYVKIFKWKWTTLLGVQIYNLPGGSEWDYYFNTNSFIALTGEDSINEGTLTYDANNSNVIRASEEHQLPDVLLGDGPADTYAGALFSYNDTTAFYATTWYYDDEEISGSVINQLRCSEFIIPQLAPVKRFSGTFKSITKNYHLLPVHYVTINSVNYVMQNCTIKTATDETEGEWIAMGTSRDGKASLTESTATRSALNNFSSANIANRTSTNLFWLMSKLATCYTTEPLPSGVAVSGLTVSGVTSEAVSGNILTVYDINTNYSIELGLTSDLSLGDSSITFNPVTPEDDIISGVYIYQF